MKKVIFALFILVGLCLNVNAQDAPSINGDFSKGILTINNVAFTKKSTIEDYEKLLGKAERIEKVAGKDKIFAYDKLGIALVLKANTNLVQDIAITYIFDGDKRVAKESFQGKLSINGQVITNKTTHEEIAKLSKTEVTGAGIFVGKGKAMNLMIYYPGETIGQFAFNFSDLK